VASFEASSRARMRIRSFWRLPTTVWDNPNSEVERWKGDRRP
jgi:hypothetical protein